MYGDTWMESARIWSNWALINSIIWYLYVLFSDLAHLRHCMNILFLNYAIKLTTKILRWVFRTLWFPNQERDGLVHNKNKWRSSLVCILLFSIRSSKDLCNISTFARLYSLVINLFYIIFCSQAVAISVALHAEIEIGTGSLSFLIHPGTLSHLRMVLTRSNCQNECLTPDWQRARLSRCQNSS